MAIAPTCDGCRQELTEYGAILFGPPETLPDGSCSKEVPKLHVCVDDYFGILEFMGVDDKFVEAEKKRLGRAQ